MGRQFEALFIRVSNPELDLARIQSEYECEGLSLPVGAHFVCVDQGEPTFSMLPTAFAEKSSAIFGEIIHVEISHEGNFHFEHWVMGTLVRWLWWTEGRPWECTGDSEPWENQAWPGQSPESDPDGLFILPERIYGILRDFFSLPPLS